MGTVKRKRKRKRRRKLSWFLKIQLLMQAAVVCALLYYFHGERLWHFVETVKEIREEALAFTAEVSAEDFGAGQPSVAYAMDGSVISIWKGSRDVSYVTLQDMPQAAVDAMICMEDRRFYRHRGVDYKALLRALWALVKNDGKVTQGGSTITMQLARSVYLTPKVSWQRKVEEIFIAWELEKTFDKEQILEFYLNNIYFGNGYYGIGAAGKGYFGKNVSDLSLSQLVYLCAIPNNPSLYDPLTSSEKTDERKVRILKKMLEEGCISEEDYAEATSVTTVLERQPPIKKNDYVQTYSTHCAVRALMKASGFEFRYHFGDAEEREAYKQEYASCYAECQKSLSSRGYQIYTSLDLDAQQRLQDSVDRELADFDELDERGVYTLQGAAVCIDNDTGLVCAIVGGRSQKFDFYTLNRGYQSFRQPGSSIKPLLVYTPAFERGYVPDTMVFDAPIPDGPKNAEGTYVGKVTVRYAVEQSLNTIAWKLFEELTPQVGLAYLTEMEFSNIVEEDYGLPSALGGLTIGVSPLEMASAFAAIENDGIFRSPTCIAKIEDADGNIVYEPERPGKRVYTREAADIMEDVMVGVMKKGTGKPHQLDDTFCAGKTGTSNECRDSWFVGYTRAYTTSVWVGYDMPKNMENINGGAHSGNIWKDFMETMR